MGEEVFSVSSVALSRSSEQSARVRMYLFAMSVRTACVIAAIVVPGWPRWVFISAAVVLPYVAVVAANATRVKRNPAPTTPG
jgi:fatty acid desaturase